MNDEANLSEEDLHPPSVLKEVPSKTTNHTECLVGKDIRVL
jgi:hypothetical protein